MGPLAVLITGLICYCYGVGMAGPLIASGCVTTCAVATNAWKKWHEGEENPSLTAVEQRVSDIEARLPQQGATRRDAASTTGSRSRLIRGDTPAYAGTTRRYRRRLFAPQSQSPAIELRMDVQASCPNGGKPATRSSGKSRIRGC